VSGGKGGEKGMSLAYYKACLIIAVIIMGIAVVLTLPNAISLYQEPHQNDPGYCDQYARQQEWHITITPDEFINPDVADRVCECKWMHDPDRKMYQDYVFCWRR
jgi:hypothetical protein